MNNYGYALRLFTDAFTGHAYTTWPFRQGAYIYATDNVGMIRVRCGSVVGEYDEREKPDAELVFQRESNRNRIYTLDGLKALFGLIPEVEFEKCDACNGTGSVDFEFEYGGDTYYTSGDCPICNGSGRKDLEKKVKDFRYGVRFEAFSLPVRQKDLNRLVLAMDSIGTDSALLVHSDGRLYKFQLSEDVEVIICAYRPDLKNEDYVVCYGEQEETE